MLAKWLNFFPTVCKFLGELSEEPDDIIPERQTRAEAMENTVGSKYLYFGYLLNGCPEASLEDCVNYYLEILEKLEESLTHRFESITENSLFKAMANFLDTRSYVNMECSDDVMDHVKVIVETFKPLLEANHCDTNKLRTEADILFEHVNRFLAVKDPNTAWPSLFRMKQELGLSNILHIAEIWIALPIANAESERVFLFLWRVFSKERQSLSNDMLEDILRLRCDSDFTESRYTHAVEMFLGEYPNGEVRKRSRRLGGHNYPKKRKNVSKKTVAEIQIDLLQEAVSSSDEEAANIEDIYLEEFSDEEWSDSENEVELFFLVVNFFSCC